MAIDYKKLPVYAQKDVILNALRDNQVIVVQSPTGSGKTTQIPVILHEAGYSSNGVIAVTQPRRIAALSVSEFIAKQLKTTYPGLVGYKMRFEDKTDETTKIKIMTDGILLQEMKLDPWMTKYSVVMVDEAHERSLNIDFVLGLLKRVLQHRSDFKVIVSSATMNAEKFSQYFNNCPIVNIETQIYPVTMIYDPPQVKASTASEAACDALISKIEKTIDRVLDNKETGDILVFLPGEKIIRDTLERLSFSRFKSKIHIVPLYGRLAKEEQERVFDNPPLGKKKVVLSTNIAETSVTINGITTVIDSGLAKLNFYSPRTFTSSLIETPVSRASCNQRRGRAGRTCAGTCYRLYSREDFDQRQEYTTEEIYRTDLSEVVLRMSELGITEFDKFDFISPPGREGILSAVETLKMLGAIDSTGNLTKIGDLMVKFPLEPRISRIIVESIMRYPDILEESLIAASYLSAQSPFVMPQGEEIEARKAHHAFRDIQGDFVSYVKLFRTYQSMKNREQFCTNNYLDSRVMAEIENIKFQLEEIVSKIGIPITGGGSMDNYLTCIASGMIQFVCIRDGKESYRSLTQDHIFLHPGSSMFRSNPLYIVAGEIVRTSRMFAMSVSPLTKNILSNLDPALESSLQRMRGKQGRSLTGGFEYSGNKFSDTKNPACKGDKKRDRKKKIVEQEQDIISFGGEIFKVQKVKGSKTVMLPVDSLITAAKYETNENLLAQIGGLKGRVLYQKNYTCLDSTKMEIIIKCAKYLNILPLRADKFDRKLNMNILQSQEMFSRLMENIPNIMRITDAKSKSKEYGFIALWTDGNGTYWFKVSRGFSTALGETIRSLEQLMEDTKDKLTSAQKDQINSLYRTLNSFYE